jgi:diphthine-ammonia ligase
VHFSRCLRSQADIRPSHFSRPVGADTQSEDVRHPRLCAEAADTKTPFTPVHQTGAERSASDSASVAPMALPPRPRAAISWSGGKDSCAALVRTRDAFDVVAMITMFDETALRSRSHGLRPEVLAAQAARLGLHQVIGRCTWATYDAAFARGLEQLAADGITHVVFGDIMFDEHRQWAERMCENAGLAAVEPLWGLSTTTLFHDWVSSGAGAVIVTARAALLDQSWLGRRLTADLLPLFERLGVDPCGERGEYHTVVTDTPLFTRPMTLRAAGAVQRADCWALDVVPDAAGD